MIVERWSAATRRQVGLSSCGIPLFDPAGITGVARLSCDRRLSAAIWRLTAVATAGGSLRASRRGPAVRHDCP
jgi:hypothetical protein